MSEVVGRGVKGKTLAEAPLESQRRGYDPLRSIYIARDADLGADAKVYIIGYSLQFIEVAPKLGLHH